MPGAARDFFFGFGARKEAGLVVAMTRRDWLRSLGLAPLALRARAQDRARASKITWENFDAAKLGAAIFAESNRVRREQKRSELRLRAELHAAADEQATTMALRLRISHDGPFAGGRTAWERVKQAGLEAEVVTENVAAISLPTEASEEKWGDTYEALAAVFVREWMESPGHRKNLLSREVTQLGCAARAARVPAGPPRVFAAQVFARPKPARRVMVP